MIHFVSLQLIMSFLSVDGARYYDEEETRTLSEMVDVFVSSCPYFLSGIAFFVASIIGMKSSFYKKWMQKEHRIKKYLIVLWWIAAILGGISILAGGFSLVQIVWTSLFEFIIDPIVSFLYWIFRWALFGVGFLFVSVGFPGFAIAYWGDKLPRKLDLILWIVVSVFLVSVLVLLSISYWEELHLFLQYK